MITSFINRLECNITNIFVLISLFQIDLWPVHHRTTDGMYSRVQKEVPGLFTDRVPMVNHSRPARRQDA